MKKAGKKSKAKPEPAESAPLALPPPGDAESGLESSRLDSSPPTPFDDPGGHAALRLKEFLEARFPGGVPPEIVVQIETVEEEHTIEEVEIEIVEEEKKDKPEEDK